ncbi:bifunctional peptidase and arginyl-hydroxylase JMJD5-like isoform X1 [Branchiostoma floridae]|uniref:Bifunctional peptidase and arginyl-hydroxylase JMJD5-like isoform X1 n=1 Tax=Branchiostoma floridae TaxID=7739 RepID=A0A9J7KQB5_BRAFL|nr:bifunctional peptidase and arginyl-hydroxylase JMJD5-like isoform X1 [Branchiostoma floridae]
MEGSYWRLVLVVCVGLALVPSRSGESVGGGSSVTPHGHLQPIGNQVPPVGMVEVLQDVPHPRDFYHKYVKPGKPVVFKDAAKETAAFKLWTDEYLSAQYGDLEVEVEEGKKENRTWPAYSMPFREFLSTYKSKDIYLVESIEPELRGEFMLLKNLLCGGFLDYLQDAVMWFSSGGTKSVLHFDAVDNINCLFEGSKELFMVDRKEYKHIDIDHQEGSFSGVDVEKVDLHKYPGLKDVPWYNATMEAGDCLFIPYKWFHHVRSTASDQKRNVAVNIWFAHLYRFDEEDCSKRGDLPDFEPLSKYKFVATAEQIRSMLLEAFELEERESISTEDLEHVTIDIDSSDEVDMSYKLDIFETLDLNKDFVVTVDEVYQVPTEHLVELFPDFSPDGPLGDNEDENEPHGHDEF